MKVFLITEADLQKLVDDNEFEKYRTIEDKSKFDDNESLIRKIHRRFHYNIVNWSQEIQNRGRI